MDKLQANIIIEILGRPIENVKEALQTIVVKLGSEPGIKLLDKKYHEPVSVRDIPDLFTSFAEVSIELDSISNFLGVIFAYMPSNIELISPERINLSNQEINQLASVLTQRLHNYDGLTKSVIFERNAIAKKLEEVSPGSLNEVINAIRPKPQENEEQELVKEKKKSEKKKAKKKK